MGNELEPIPYGSPIMRETAHWQEEIEKAQAREAYCQEKYNACIEILKSSSIIWVEDERWQRG